MGLTPIRVKQLNGYISRILSVDPLLSDVAVIGEISNLKFQNSGHIYFSLKDDSSAIRCFLPAGTAPQIVCPLEEGLEVIVSGRINVYVPGGYYSLLVTDVEAEGKGQLAARFEQLKEKLNREGLFDPAHKKQLPLFPKKVAVVTSPTGAAVRDIQRTIRNKNDVVSILIVPVLVQGPAAAAEIAAAIDNLNAHHKDVDVIIAGRGGGSTEELWAFNEEIVARSIYASDIPVISAVGHETDFTIADFVSDHRAATPTAAAEIAVPDTGELREHLDWLRDDLAAQLLRKTELARRHLQMLDPLAFAAGIRQRIEAEQKAIEQTKEGMDGSMVRRIEGFRQRIELLRQLLESASPFEILERGYSMVTDESGRLLRSAQEADPGQNVIIRMAGGSLDAKITGRREEDSI